MNRRAALAATAFIFGALAISSLFVGGIWLILKTYREYGFIGLLCASAVLCVLSMWIVVYDFFKRNA